MRRTLPLVLLLFATACASSEVYVVRHAEAYKNLKPRPDLPPAQLDSLTETGKQQAARLADELQGRGVTIVLHSPTGRTTETAAIIATALGVPAEAAPELAPLAGPWSARPSAWAAGEDPRPDGGESMADGVHRAMALLERYPGQPVVVVTHGDIAAGLIGEGAATPMPARWAVHEPTGGSLTVVSDLR